MVMETLNGLLQERTSRPDFIFQKCCKTDKITHLCFSKDMISFAHGEINPTLCLMDALHNFSTLTGLQFNPSKSQVYFSGLSAVEKDFILEHLLFQEGTLPFRYLGIPLITRRLFTSDCKTLSDRVMKRIEGWGSKNVSYSGRWINSNKCKDTPLLDLDVKGTMLWCWRSVLKAKFLLREIILNNQDYSTTRSYKLLAIPSEKLDDGNMEKHSCF
ncbi:uncharacterized protein LOC131149773 [Malania oleifera]|uniref:uncharacterized protein LOC131149773 n=1 Tax=Malania oleifera TaxID=397392 RepID=UPI0025AEC8D1|nr:uncharacterized protein LOC131149773 [Malania oleifera]